MAKQKTVEPSEPQRLAVKLGENEISIMGTPEFIERWADWWEQQIANLEVPKGDQE